MMYVMYGFSSENEKRNFKKLEIDKNTKYEKYQKYENYLRDLGFSDWRLNSATEKRSEYIPKTRR